MGICCGKTQKQTSNAIEMSSKPDTSNKGESQQQQPNTKLTVTVTSPTASQYYDNDGEKATDLQSDDNNYNSDENVIPTMNSTHWKTQTLQLLTQLSDDVQLGPDFEGPDHEENHDDELKQISNNIDNDIENNQHYSSMTASITSPKKLINIPRKRYLPKRSINSKFELNIGTTLKRGHNESDEKSVWKPCDASNFKLRPIEYASNKRSKFKPSKDALYDIIGVDCFLINDEDVKNQDVNEILHLFNINARKYRQNHNNKEIDKYPNVIIVNLLIPLFSKKERNGLQILIYGKISDQFVNNLNDPSVELLEKLLNLEKFQQESFKLTVSIPNVKETTLNKITKKLVKTLNGKCMATRKHATFGYLSLNNDKDEEEKMENKNVFVVNFNAFGLSKKMIKGLSTIKGHLQTIDFEIGFHIGTKIKETLPERILLCTKINKLDTKNLMTFNEFYTKSREEYDARKKSMDEEKAQNGHSRVQTYVMDDTVDYD